MATRIVSRNAQQTADQTMIDGLKKHEPTLSSLVIGGTSYKTSDLIGILQTRIDARNSVVSSRATWQANVKADHDERAQTKTLVSGLRQALLVAFAGQIDALADFGLKPRKTRVVTPEEKTAAAAKAKATRKARNTLGSKQKKGVKGDVTGVVVTPVTATKPNTTARSTRPTTLKLPLRARPRAPKISLAIQ